MNGYITDDEVCWYRQSIRHRILLPDNAIGTCDKFKLCPDQVPKHHLHSHLSTVTFLSFLRLNQ